MHIPSFHHQICGTFVPSNYIKYSWVTLGQRLVLQITVAWKWCLRRGKKTPVRLINPSHCGGCAHPQRYSSDRAPFCSHTGDNTLNRLWGRQLSVDSALLGIPGRTSTTGPVKSTSNSIWGRHGISRTSTKAESPLCSKEVRESVALESEVSVAFRIRKDTQRDP